MNETSISPGGRYVVEADPWEARNSQWVYTPRVIDLITAQPVLALSDPRWSMDSADWVSDSEVFLRLRKFPGNHLPIQLDVLVNCDEGNALVAANQRCSLAELEAVLDAAFTKAPSQV